MGPKRSGVQAHVCPSSRQSGSFTGSSPLPQTATQPGVSLLGLWEELDLSGPFLCPQHGGQGQSRGQVRDASRLSVGPQHPPCHPFLGQGRWVFWAHTVD